MVAKCWFLGFVTCNKTYVFSHYHNPDLYKQIFDCLPTSMATVLAADVCTSFLFVGDLNGHHQEWLGFTTTNRHGVAAFDVATVSGCDELVVGPTHACGGTFDLLMTDVPDLVWVAVVAPIGNWITPLCWLILMVRWPFCGAIQDLPWHNIWPANNPVLVLNEYLLLLIGCFVAAGWMFCSNQGHPCGQQISALI